MTRYLLYSILLAVGVQAQPLSPDATFGVNGVANTDIIGRRHVFTAPNNKIYTIEAFLESVVSFNEDGSPDNNFGGDGNVDFASVFGNYNYDVNWITTNQTNLFAAGVFHLQGSETNNIFVAKMDFDGNPDPAFGTDGIAALDYGQDESMWTAHLTNSGKIMCVGFRHIDNQTKMILMLLNSDGTKDMTFGTGGIKEYAFFSSVTFPGSVIIDSNDKIYVSCMGANNGVPAESCIVKLDMAGNLVPGFGSGGILHFNTPNVEQISKLMLKGKNLYTLADYYEPSIGEYVNTLRVYDLVDEVVTLALPLNATTRITDFHVWPNEKIMVYGYIFCSDGCYGYDVKLAQYNADGTQDAGFANNGTYQFNFNTVNGNNTYEISGRIHPVADEKILLSAEYWLAPVTASSNTPYLTMARLSHEALGIDGQSAPSIILYPNPATTNLNVALPTMSYPATVSVYDALGRISLKRELQSVRNSISLDLESLASGIYVVKLTDNQKTYTKKFIKQ